MAPQSTLERQENFALTMEACTRLRHLSLDVEVDRSFEAKGGKIFYAVDNDVLNFFADPINSKFYADVFEHQPGLESKSIKFHGKDADWALVETAMAILFGIFGDDSAETFPIPLLLLPAYEKELASSAIHFRKATAPRRRKVLDATALDAAINKIDAVLADFNSQVSNPLQAFYDLLTASDPVVQYALFPETSPLARLSILLRKGLKKSNQDLLDPKINIEVLRDGSEWLDTYQELLKQKDRKNRDSVARDTDAIVWLAEFNRIAARTIGVSDAPGRRALLLTGDAAIARMLADTGNKIGRRYAEDLGFCLVRHPLQIGGFRLLEGGSGIGPVGDRNRISYFDDFLRARQLSRTEYEDALMKARFSYTSIPQAAARIHGGLESPLRDQIEIRLRELIKDMNRPAATSIAFFASHRAANIQAQLAKYKKDVFALIRDGIASVEASAARLSQLLGVTLMASEIERSGLEWILKRTLFAAGRLPHDNGKFTAVKQARLPCFLRFSESQLGYFTDLLHLQESHASDDVVSNYLNSVQNMDLLEYNLANAYLSAVCNDWRKAARWCEAATKSPTAETEAADRVFNECLYFRAVALRHWVRPDLGQWREAASSLKDLSDKTGSSVDLRMRVEYAALGLSVPYHAYFYADRSYLQVSHPEPNETRLRLLDCLDRYEAWTERRDHLWWRLGVQLYANLALIRIFERILPPKISFGCGDDWPLREYANAIRNLADIAGGEDSLSYFVKFILLAIDFELSAQQPQDARSALFAGMDDIQGAYGKLIIPYDQKKMDDFRLYASR